MSANTKSARDILRATIFDNAQPKKEIIDFFGTKIELRQPALDRMESFQGDDAKARLPKMIMELAYVPGTDEKIFEEADYDMIAGMPFSKDISAFMETFTTMTELSVEDKAKN